MSCMCVLVSYPLPCHHFIDDHANPSVRYLMLILVMICVAIIAAAPSGSLVGFVQKVTYADDNDAEEDD
jgi:type III secretory pathway component EscS